MNTHEQEVLWDYLYKINPEDGEKITISLRGKAWRISGAVLEEAKRVFPKAQFVIGEERSGRGFVYAGSVFDFSLSSQI